MAFIKWLHSITDVPEHLKHWDEESSKRIVTIQRLTLTGVGLLALYVPMTLLLGFSFLSWIYAANTILFFLVFLGIRKTNWPWFWVYLGFVHLMTYSFIVSVITGYHSSFHLFFLSYIGLSFFLLPPQQKIARSCFFIVNATLFLTLETLELKTWVWVPDHPNLPELRLFNGAVMFIFIAVLFRIFENESLAQAKEIRIQDQQLVRANQLSSLGTMSAGIAHEVNNPLAIISASLTRLQKICAKGEVEKEKDLIVKYMNYIGNGVDRISQIVSGLRSLSRDDNDSEFEAVSVRQIINDTLIFCSQRLYNLGIRVSIDGDVEKAFISCRPVQISQVFLNLLQNSADAIEPLKQRWLKVNVRIDKPHVYIRITDSGPGIPKKHQDHIFSPFFTTKPVGKGTGLGLSLSRSIIENHNGHLSYLDHEPNTTFEIELPLAETTSTDDRTENATAMTNDPVS